jgi:hypothetical protein
MTNCLHCHCPDINILCDNCSHAIENYLTTKKEFLKIKTAFIQASKEVKRIQFSVLNLNEIDLNNI